MIAVSGNILLVSHYVFIFSLQLYISSELSMEVAYYNETLAVWEPLIEPTLCDDVMKPWEVTAEVTKL